MASKWDAIAPKIRAWAAKGMSDPEIAARLEIADSYVAQLRYRYGIPAGQKRGRKLLAPPPPPAELPTYVDADGNTVKMCPTRYVAPMSGWMVRPSRGRGRPRE